MKIIELTNKSKPRIVRAERNGETYVLVPWCYTADLSVPERWHWVKESDGAWAKDCHGTIDSGPFEALLALVDKHGATLLDEPGQEDWESALPLYGGRRIYAQFNHGYGLSIIDTGTGDDRWKWFHLLSDGFHLSDVEGKPTPLEATKELISHFVEPKFKPIIRLILADETDHGRIITALMKGEEVTS